MTKRVSSLVSIVLALVLVTLSAAVGAAETFKLYTPTVTTHPWHRGAERFAAIVKEKTGGAIDVKIYPNSELGSERDALELVKLGTIQTSFNTVGSAGTFIPSLNIFNLPFLFKSEEDAQKFAAGPLAQKLASTCERSGFVCLAFHSSFFRYPMNSKRPLNTIADFSGLKIRTMQVPAHVDTYKALGASPTPIAFGDLYNALALGTVDGNENAIVTLEGLKMYEVQKYLSLVPILTTTGVTLVSKKVWDGLSPASREALREAARTSAHVIDQGYVEDQKRSLEILKAKGVTVNVVKDLAPFRKAVQGVYEKYLPTLPKEAQDVVRELLKH